MNRSAAEVVLVPAALVAVTCTVPEPGGTLTEISESETTTNTAVAAPNDTLVTLVNPVPWMVTLLVTTPAFGTRLVMIGAP